MEGQNTLTIGNLTINTEEVEKLLQKRKINKESGPDDIPAFILRETVTELAPVFTTIFNQYIYNIFIRTHICNIDIKKLYTFDKFKIEV